MMTKVFMWKKLYIQVIEHTKNYFHITSTTASNLNKLINYMIFCHFKLPSAPTQDKFLDFLQHDFSKLNLLQKAFFFFHLNGGQALCACACPDGHAPPFKWKKAFWKYFECENSFCKKSRNLSWGGVDFNLKWLNFPKNAWYFALFEIWSGCRCDMKIIIGVLDNLDVKLLSNTILWSWHAWSIWFWKCILH